jgi:sugar phosphate isomerase/epimerase
MMKLGFVSAILPDQSFEYVVDVAANNGFKCVEVACWPKGQSERRYAGITHINIDALTADKAEEINVNLNHKGIAISALGYYPNPLDADLEKRTVYIEHIKKIINNAGLLGVDIVSTFIGRNPHQSLADNMDEFKKVWPDIIKLAEDKNVRIAIENCPMFFTTDEWPSGKNLATTPRIWDDMFGLIPSRHFGLNYDPSHFLWQQMDYIKPIYDYSEKLFHVHVKDAKIHYDKLNYVGILATPLEFHTPKLPGLGDINWSKFISALTDVRYSGPLVIEVEDKVFEDTLEDRLIAIQQSKRYISQFIL